MKISSFEDIMKYISKYRNNPKKISKLKENFTEYLDLCNEQNIIALINEIKNIPEMHEGIRIKYYTIDEFIKDLLDTNEIKYICSNMEQIINCSDMQLLIKKIY